MMTLYFVIPCYNEEKVLNITFELFINKLQDLIDKKIVNANSKILYVDDGSSDNTLACIKELNKKNKEVLCISLSKNRGHQNALLAGLMTAKSYADIIISMDCDGQDDINAVNKMIEKYNDGCDIVYGVRNERKTDSFFKRNTALLFYKFINSLGVESIYNHADFRY